MPRTRRQSSAHDSEEYYNRDSSDIEKDAFDHRDSSDDSDYHPPSTSEDSRESYGSTQPILGSGRTRRRASSYYSYRLPHRTTRWLCIALMSTIILFILSLVRSSWNSAQHLESQFQKSPPPKAAWESFDFLTRYYGGVRNLVPRDKLVPEYPAISRSEQTSSNATKQERDVPMSKPFNPYPDYTSTDYKLEYGPVQECYLNEEDKLKVPGVHAYEGVPQGMPNPATGSYEELGIWNTVCFDRFGRLGPYGLGYSTKKGGIGASLDGEREGADNVWQGSTPIDYSKIHWAGVQQKCLAKNKHRFEPVKPVAESSIFLRPHGIGDDTQRREEATFDSSKNETLIPRAAPYRKVNPFRPKMRPTASIGPATLKYIPRAVILIRTWHNFVYTEEDILYIRSLIAELALLSGGEYTIHFLIHVKDDNLQIWADQATYDRVLEEALPAEFHGMGSLWSERQMGLIYGGVQESFYRDLPVHGAYRSSFMCVQWYAHTHPEYDFFWNWEMDARYTGHWYQLFSKITQWAKDQPRKELWERNARFYVPAEHGSWEDFKQMVRIQTQQGTATTNNLWAGIKKIPGANGLNAKAKPLIDPSVWGPLAPKDVLENEDDPKPPRSYEEDRYVWGVDEEADLITLNPIFDPEGTSWTLAEDFTGYNTDKGLPPRRAAIVTASRLSRRLLDTMHREVSLKRHTMFSEMWPATCALHHGLKAVYVPHPVYIDRNWPTQYLASVFNGGKNGAAGAARTSVFGDREHNFRGTTWYYNAGFSPNLWRRWLGYRVDQVGGEQDEVAGEGRMCLPQMLLHPIKDVKLVIEGKREE